MTAFKELDMVVLTHDLAGAGLRAGDIGTIVLTHGADAAEVEFLTTSGEFQTVETLLPDDFRPATEEELRSVNSVGREDTI